MPSQLSGILQAFHSGEKIPMVPNSEAKGDFEKLDSQKKAKKLVAALTPKSFPKDLLRCKMYYIVT